MKSSKDFLIRGLQWECASISDDIKALDAYWQFLKQENSLLDRRTCQLHDDQFRIIIIIIIIIIK